MYCLDITNIAAEVTAVLGLPTCQLNVYTLLDLKVFIKIKIKNIFQLNIYSQIVSVYFIVPQLRDILNIFEERLPPRPPSLRLDESQI